MYRAITLFCAAALVACAPAKLYRYGETAASPSAIGVLKGPHYIQIVSIDGVTEMERPGCTGPACTEGFEIYFSPGVHRLTVKFGDSVSKAGPLTLSFPIAAGERYEFRNENEQRGRFTLWRPKIVNSSGVQVSQVVENAPENTL